MLADRSRATKPCLGLSFASMDERRDLPDNWPG
jgi:hypothetical protein